MPFCRRHDYPCSLSHIKVPKYPTILIKEHVARKSSKHTISFILVSEVSFIHVCGPLLSTILVQYLYFSLKGKHTHLYKHSLYTIEFNSLQGLKHAIKNKTQLKDVPELSSTQSNQAKIC